jgi:hypothetical protein
LDLRRFIMSETSEVESANLKKVEAETRKLETEIRKLESEITAARSGQLRGWIVSLSVVVGIAVSVVGVKKSLHEIEVSNLQLGIEAQVRSHEIFLNQVLDRMSSVKTAHYEVDQKTGKKVFKSQDEYGHVTQVGSYGSAVSLACRFDNLRLPAQSALTYQVARYPADITAREMLQRIERECPPGWDRLTEQETAEWSKIFASK